MKAVKKYCFLWGEETRKLPGETVNTAGIDPEAAFSSGYAAFWDGYDVEPCPFTDPAAVASYRDGYRTGQAESAELDRTPAGQTILKLLLPVGGRGTHQQPDGSWLFWGPPTDGRDEP